MFKWIIGAALLASTAGMAQAHGRDQGKGHAGSRAASASKMVCPMTHEDAAPNALQSVRFNGETVTFCCAGCKADFARLSTAQKKSRVAQAKKIAAARASKAKKSG